ncbi:MAG: glycosyltransferase family 2 protein [Geoalkalibacter sp.]|uniref:glycosyltransferase family 2 protein n=1 Tax=Geoalkalibacter sp. TaxID=3041440 RepID=UPI003D151134
MTLSNADESFEDTFPRVSLVTPSYNAAAYLRAAIESVLGQDYPNIEYLVMDGGSTDGTVELLKHFDTKLRWVSEKDDGQSDAIARGFEQTNGTILGWLNADDVLKPGAVRAAVDAFRANRQAALVYGNADFIDAEGRTLGPCTVVESYSRFRLLHYGDYIIQPAAFFSRQAYNDVGGLDKSLHWAMDWDLWIRLSQRNEVVYIDKDLASYRWLGSNKTAEGGLDRLNEVESVARRYGCKGLPAYFRLEKARLLASQSRQDLQQEKYLLTLDKLVQSAATILGSWRAVTSLLSPHVWRNYRTAKALYRHVEEQRVGLR